MTLYTHLIYFESRLRLMIDPYLGTPSPSRVPPPCAGAQDPGAGREYSGFICGGSDVGTLVYPGMFESKSRY